jgi:hypothetical protein
VHDLEHRASLTPTHTHTSTRKPLKTLTWLAVAQHVEAPRLGNYTAGVFAKTPRVKTMTLFNELASVPPDFRLSLLTYKLTEFGFLFQVSNTLCLAFGPLRWPYLVVLHDIIFRYSLALSQPRIIFQHLSSDSIISHTLTHFLHCKRATAFATSLLRSQFHLSNAPLYSILNYFHFFLHQSSSFQILYSLHCPFTRLQHSLFPS